MTKNCSYFNNLSESISLPINKKSGILQKLASDPFLKPKQTPAPHPVKSFVFFLFPDYLGGVFKKRQFRKGTKEKLQRETLNPFGAFKLRLYEIRQGLSRDWEPRPPRKSETSPSRATRSSFRIEGTDGRRSPVFAAA